jgi:hypothetical protein
MEMFKYVLTVALLFWISTAMADGYEEKAASGKLGASATAQQAANMDLAPIFRCVASWQALNGNAKKRSECMNLVNDFEKKGGQKFEDSKYPQKGLKKMVSALKAKEFPAGKFEPITCSDAGGRPAKGECKCPDGPFIQPDQGVTCAHGDYSGYCKSSGGKVDGSGCWCQHTGIFINPYIETCKPPKSQPANEDSLR